MLIRVEILRQRDSSLEFLKPRNAEDLVPQIPARAFGYLPSYQPKSER